MEDVDKLCFVMQVKVKLTGGSVGQSIVLYEPKKSAHDSLCEEDMGDGGSTVTGI